MEFYDAVYVAAGKRDMTIEGLSLSMGHNASYIANAVSRGSQPRVDTATKILDACDFAMCVLPKESVPDEAIVIDYDEE